MAAASEVQLLRDTIGRYLTESFGVHDVDADGDFMVRQGSAVTYLRPLPWADGQTIVRIWSITNVGVRVDGELTRFLATESGKFVFGGLQLDEQGGKVLFGHTLLGDFLSRKELADAVVAVASTADHYDDQIKARFGGRLFGETAEAPSATPAAAGTAAVHRYFGLLGLAAGIGAAVASYRLIDDDWWLAAFALVLASYVVGRGVGDLLTDPNKGRRALYFALTPAISVAVVYAAHAAWDRWWLAVLLGLVGGGLLAGAVGATLMPRIHGEEVADTRRRWRTT